MLLTFHNNFRTSQKWIRFLFC